MRNPIDMGRRPRPGRQRRVLYGDQPLLLGLRVLCHGIFSEVPNRRLDYIDPIYYDMIQPPGKPQKTAVFYFPVDWYAIKCDNDISIRFELFKADSKSLFDIVNKLHFRIGLPF